SNASGVGTYLDLVDGTPVRVCRQLRHLRLQSPGGCVYLGVRGPAQPPYLRFYFPGGGELCMLLVRPTLPAPDLVRDGWQPARLLAPMPFEQAQSVGRDGQRAYLDAVVQEKWWRPHVGDHRILAAPCSLA